MRPWLSRLSEGGFELPRRRRHALVQVVDERLHLGREMRPLWLHILWRLGGRSDEGVAAREPLPGPNLVRYFGVFTPQRPGVAPLRLRPSGPAAPSPGPNSFK